MAEGFGFQTLQTLQPTLQPFKGRKQADDDFTKMGSEKSEAGPDVTTRRVDAPKPGLVCQESEEYGKRAYAEGYLHAEPS